VDAQHADLALERGQALAHETLAAGFSRVASPLTSPELATALPCSRQLRYGPGDALLPALGCSINTFEPGVGMSALIRLAYDLPQSGLAL